MKGTSRRRFVINSALSACGLALADNLLKNNFDPISVALSGQSEISLAMKLSGIKPKHPYLHFDADRLRELRTLSASGTYKQYAGKLFEWVEENKGWSPPVITGDDGDEEFLEECAAYVTNTSLAFCLSKKPEYLNLAIKWSLEMCKYPEDAIRNYAIGIYAAGLARVYDWLYNDIPKADRLTIKTAITGIVSRMYERSLPGKKDQLWWADAYLHHDHWIAVGGYGEASLALLGEVEGAAKYAAHAKADFDRIFTWLGNDGAWHEGAADWCYALAPLLWFYGAWSGTVKEDPFSNDWIKNTAIYRLYHWLPDNSYIYLDDSFRSGRYSTSGSASCHLLRRLASIYGNGYAQWLAEKDETFDLKPSPKGVYKAPYEKLSFLGEPSEYLHAVSQVVSWNLLWYDPAVKSVHPENLPLSHHFKNEGIVIMRTGWNSSDAVISFSCAPLAGHVSSVRVQKGEEIDSNFYEKEHLDFSSFTLFANGQYFIVPSGYARRGSCFQNVVSVNGAEYDVNPASDIKIAAYINEKNFIYASGDATNAFLPQTGVGFYRRHLLLLDKAWLIIFDDLVLNNEGRRTGSYNRFSWTVHNDPETHSVDIDNNKIMWSPKLCKQPPLTMFLLEPGEFAWESGNLQSNRNKGLLGKLQLTKPEWNSGRMQTITAWSWDKYPDSPVLYKSREIIAIILNERKAAGFSLIKGIPAEVIQRDLSKYELLLFGHDPADPNSFVTFREGRQV